MSLLEERYYGNEYNNNQEPDELELALQEAYEAGLNDGYNEALNEGVMDKLKAAKNWVKNNKYRLGGRALQALGGLGIADNALNVRGDIYSKLSDCAKDPECNKMINRELAKDTGKLALSGLMLYGGNKLMKKHNSPKNKLMGLINK